MRCTRPGGLSGDHCGQGRHPTGHADACGASGTRPFGLDGRIRVHAELPLSELCVPARLRRGFNDDGDTPVVAAQGSGGYVRQGTRAAGGPSRRAASPSRRYISPARETRVTTASGGNGRSEPGDVWNSPDAFRRRLPCLAICRVVERTGSACLMASGRPPWLRRGIARRRHCAGRFVIPTAMSLRTPCRFWLDP